MSIKKGHTIEKLTFDIQIPSEKQFMTQWQIER